jgi:hypothetical protein
LFCSISASAFAADKLGDDEVSRRIYNIIFDIGVSDRDAYVEIMKNILNKNEMGAGVIAGQDAEGVVTYSVNITIQDKDTKEIVFDRLFHGAYKSDFSDVIKTPMEIKKYISDEDFKGLQNKRSAQK